MNKKITLYDNLVGDYQNCAYLYPFRIFYNLNRDDKTPKKLEYKLNKNIPDYIIKLSTAFYQAFDLYSNKLKLKSPLKEGIYFDKGASFIDIMIVNIPMQKGLVAAELIDNSDCFLGRDNMYGKSIQIKLDKNLVDNTATPIHELFHVFQYNYSNFNNMWFMEGLARWSQNLTHKRKIVDEKLPQSVDELEYLLNRKHDAEYFFRKLISLCNDDTKFIKLLLENCIIQEKHLCQKNSIKRWTKELKKADINNEYILQAIIDTVNELQESQNEELKKFMELIKKENKTNITKSKTVIITNQKELDLLEDFEEIDGDLIIDSSDLVQINTLNKLKKVNTIKIKNNKNIVEINGFNGLVFVKNIELSNNINLTSIYGFFKFFNLIGSIDGYIKIEKNKKLEDILFLKGLKRVGSSFYLHHNNLQSLEGLEYLEEVGASLSLSSNALKNLKPLKNLKRINGMLGVAYNQLITLDGLESLREVGVTKWGNEYRSIAIQENQYLNNVQGLRNIMSNTKHCIVHMNKNNKHLHIPSKNSDFYKQSIKLIDDNSEFEVNTIFINYVKSKKVKVLFYDTWRKALGKLDWLESYFMLFTDGASVIKYCKKRNIQYIYAQKYSGQKFLFLNENILKENGLKFIVNNLDLIQILIDKQKFYKYILSQNLSYIIPKYYATQKEIKYPCLSKSKIAANGDTARIIYNEEELGTITSDEVVNEYIPGKTEYASNIFYKNGEIIADVTYEKSFNYDYYILNQETKYKMIDKRINNPFIEDFEKMIKTFVGDNGSLLCCIDYKIKDNQPKIFEINTRLGYTLARHSEDFKEMMQKYMQECDNV